MRLKRLRGYTAFSKAAILDGFAYKFSFVGWVLGDLLSLVVIFFLWQAIYKNNPESMINGFTLSEMISYLVIARITTTLVFSSASFWIFSHDILEGSIAINLIKPINYRYRLHFISWGNMICAAMIMFLPLIIIGQIVLYFTVGMAVPGFVAILCFLVTVILSFMVYECLDFLIGQLAVYTQSLFGVYLAKAALFAFLSGSALPTSFFPAWLRGFTKVLPLASIVETPVLIYQGKINDPTEILLGWAIQIAWIIGLMFITNFTFSRLRKKVVSVGG